MIPPELESFTLCKTSNDNAEAKFLPKLIVSCFPSSAIVAFAVVLSFSDITLPWGYAIAIWALAVFATPVTALSNVIFESAFFMTWYIPPLAVELATLT